MANLELLPCGCTPPLLIISQVQPINEAFIKAVLSDPCIVVLVRIDRTPTVGGRC